MKPYLLRPKKPYDCVVLSTLLLESYITLFAVA
jgi:hypothetical protein